eukprot:GEMP01031081.1.p1 GENE.GEMP01031081.1~~GEMP01031081.1.p1  ORF type:complete len:251 (+),score=41.00 GEMP01031081.1:198-950(+)
MGIAIECIVFDTPVRFELMIVPMCMFAITLIQFAYAAILHYGLGNLPAAIDANLYADVQLTVSVCLLDFGLTVYALESENVPWHADHIRTIAVAFRVWTFHLLLQMGPEIQDFWVVLPSGILSASNFAFYCTVYLFRRHAIDFWPPRALIKSELAYYDFPVTRLIVIATVFTYYLSRLSCLSAFLYIQPYLYFAYSYRIWGRDNWLNKAILYVSTIAIAVWCSYYIGSMTPCLVLILDVAWRPVTNLHAE